MTDWIEWNGGGCPFNIETRDEWVCVKLRGDPTDCELWDEPIMSSEVGWEHADLNDPLRSQDIIAYRIVEVN